MERKTVLQENPRSSSHRMKDRNSKCADQVTEFACSACVCCVSCPIAVVWCFIMLPCKIGWRAVRTAADWACSCGSRKRVLPEYSSFSDIDFDVLPRTTNSSGDLIGSSNWRRRDPP
ncbi:hypothetical protein SLEP1_g50593 [Rubroshorea leprosula]|uniref:Uncharacterized protein n=1 Tax=Rubroshorea leprosula TaxID=152421 RepID=A0AAV5M0J2_9ROSI|nr:hypothetical protein SLEP1_g50593 [Rubroshorea leprosula]